MSVSLSVSNEAVCVCVLFKTRHQAPHFISLSRLSEHISLFLLSSRKDNGDEPLLQLITRERMETVSLPLRLQLTFL